MTPRLFIACLVLAATLAGCNGAGPSPAPRASVSAGYASENYTPPGFQLPGGQGCQGDVARFRALMANDYATGNVGLGVYKRIESEIDEADHACSAGENARASAMIRVTKSKFGYPA